MSMNSTASKPVEIKREEFRKYLEHAGVLDSLTNVLISLYEEQHKPDDGIEYFRKFFANDAAESQHKNEIEALRKELAEAKAQISELKEKVKQLEASNPCN